MHSGVVLFQDAGAVFLTHFRSLPAATQVTLLAGLNRGIAQAHDSEKQDEEDEEDDEEEEQGKENEQVALPKPATPQPDGTQSAQGGGTVTVSMFSYEHILTRGDVFMELRRYISTIHTTRGPPCPQRGG